ncbi:MAG: hypothetical protein ACTS68_02020, partial [Candidatus Hodgkinia cicadicola]
MFLSHTSITINTVIPQNRLSESPQLKQNDTARRGAGTLSSSLLLLIPAITCSQPISTMCKLYKIVTPGIKLFLLP